MAAATALGLAPQSAELTFGEELISTRMSRDFIALDENLTVSQAMDALSGDIEKSNNYFTIFTYDSEGKYSGAAELREILLTNGEGELYDVTVASFPFVYENELTSQCVSRLSDYSENLVPVLDEDKKQVGVITIKNVIDAVEKEYGQSYAKLAGLSHDADLSESLIRSMKKRLPWLLTLLALGMLVSTVVGAFERVIERLTIIMAFQSLILDMAGNVGTQSLAVTIRVLTDEGLTFGKKAALVWKEMRVGFFNGALLGALSIPAIGLYITFAQHRPAPFSFAVSACIGVSLLTAMFISSAVGTLTPIALKKLKIDPAVASGPLITTVNDLVAVITYYGLSKILLIDLLHLG